MTTVTLQDVTQLAETLPYADKLALVDRLLKLAQQEAIANRDKSGAQAFSANGHSDKPDVIRRCEKQWLKDHRAEYAGQYVVVEGDRLVSHGTDGRRVLAEARQAGIVHPFIIRIEAEGELPFGGW